MGGLVDEGTDRRMDGERGGWTDKWMEKRMEGYIYRWVG